MRFFVTYKESLKFTMIVIPDVETLTSEVKWLNEWNSDPYEGARIGEVDSAAYDRVTALLSPYYDVHEDIQFSCF